MYDIDVRSVCDKIRRDQHRKPLRWHLLGTRNGHKVYIRESDLKNPYYDYSKGFSDIQKPFKPRNPIRRPAKPWYPQSLIGELLWSLFEDVLDMMSGRRN